MHLRDQGFTFCVHPDKQRGQWVGPAERKHFYADWADVTDWPDAKLVAFLMPEPEQRDLFAA